MIGSRFACSGVSPRVILHKRAISFIWKLFVFIWRQGNVALLGRGWKGGGAGSGPTSTSSNGHKGCVCQVNVVFFLWKIILSFILLNGNVPPTEWTNSAYFMVRFITMENKPFHCLKMQHLFPFWVPNWPLLGENGKVGQNRTMNTKLACLKAET